MEKIKVDEFEEIKKYRETHKEEIKEYKKKYRETHKEEIKEYAKKYREKHKEEITKYDNKQFECKICGGHYLRKHKARHEKTQKHIMGEIELKKSIKGSAKI